jgi:hypothetical protein
LCRELKPPTHKEDPPMKSAKEKDREKMFRRFKKEDEEIKTGEQTVRSITKTLALLEQLKKSSLVFHTAEGLCADVTVDGAHPMRDRTELLVSPQADSGSSWASLDRISLKGVV